MLLLPLVFGGCSRTVSAQAMANETTPVNPFISINVSAGMIKFFVDSSDADRKLLTGFRVVFVEASSTQTSILVFKNGVVFDANRKAILDLRNLANKSDNHLNGYRVYWSMVVLDQPEPTLTLVPYFGNDNHPGDNVTFSWNKGLHRFEIMGGQIP